MALSEREPLAIAELDRVARSFEVSINDPRKYISSQGTSDWYRHFDHHLDLRSYPSNNQDRNKMATPGLTFVASSVLDPATTSDEKYNKFYNDEHLPDVLASGLTKIALRYKNTNSKAKMPYLALYPVEDASMTGSEAAGKLIQDTRKSKTFDGGDIYDFIKFDIRRYEKIQTYEAYQQEGRSGKERGQTIICVAMEPGDEADFEEWYRKQHLDMLAMCRGYRRCTRYRNVDGTEPRFLALHEYACKPEDLPSEQVKQVVSTEWSKKIIGEAKVFERDVFALIQAQGETELDL